MESIEDALEIDEPLEDGLTVTAGFKGETFRLRTYQAEMVEKSLDANIIVAMDTGSGKTHMNVLSSASAWVLYLTVNSELLPELQRNWNHAILIRCGYSILDADAIYWYLVSNMC